MEKEKFNKSFRSSLLLTIKIWSSAWMAFFISLIPMYIWRGIYHGDFDIRSLGENIIIATVGIIVGFFVLMLRHGKSDEAERLSNAEMCQNAGLAVGIYIAAWMLVWVIAKNNYLIACCGYHLEIIFGLNADNRPTFFSAITAALIYGFFYFLAIILGTKMAQKRRNIRNTY